MATWLARQGIASVQRVRRTGQLTCYEGLGDSGPLATPVVVRLYQRRSRLQVHHVEALLGDLSCRRLPLGLLITTGGFTPEAAALARAQRMPRLRLYTGPQFAQDLAGCGLALERRSVLRWVLRDVVAA